VKTTSLNALLLTLLFAPLGHAAAEPASPGGEAPLDQVVVEATRTNLVKLGQEVLKAEYRFYQRYNELNTKRDYEVRCYKEAPIGTRLTRAWCQPVFESKVEQAQAREFLLILQGSGSSARGVNPATAAIEVRRPGFQQNMMEVTRKNPELIKLLDEHAALVKRFQDMYREVHHVAPPPEENAAAPAAPAASRDSK
jgi:hypothetical protein